ncbi:MAG: EscU/YscU/HrcU family type III secretion system export apparatus switch protein [Nitrospirae bacterium]|nr:MAG: EscU/YscU/HrcU family type III secretion system export apparatus switch protein [Nitrospirota bacterium]
MDRHFTQAGERTEQATTRRREDARRKGQVASSREVSIATSLTATVAAGSFMGVYAIGLLTTTMQRWLAAAGTTSLTESTLPTLAMHVGRDILAVVIPFGLLLVGLAVGAHILQTGWVWSTERLQWDLTRLSPMAGLKRLLSLRALMELPKSLFKIGIVTGLVYWNLKDEVLALPLMLQMEPQAVLFQAGRLAWSLTLWIAGALGVLARMTREEVKREQRETEGDPLIRSRIRTLQRERARRRMMQEVPKADVVITNPTHLAVALKYDGIRMAAPTVVAKGAGYIAERIRQVAAEHGVPIIENKPLARSLHKLVDLGREIPSELYQAVAEILALVLRSKGRL